MRRSLVSLLLLAAPLAAAQTPGTCTLGTAQGDLVTPDLFARLFNTGSLFYGGTTTNGDGYLVPRSPARSPLFAAGLWAGGTVGGDLRVAGSRYTNFTFWPGPLDAGASLPNASDCSAYDRIWVVAPADVAAYNSTGVATADLAEWPVGLGAPTVDANGQPVAVVSRSQVVNLAAGERPAAVHGPTAFWVMNDVGGPHTALGTLPLGIEVQVTALAIEAEASAALRQSTAYRYRIVNRNALPIDSLRVGFFADPDLGNAVDDYMGVDTTLAMGYAYNGRAEDSVYGVPPALGLDALGGLWAASVFTDGGPTGKPSWGEGVYRRLQGLWTDGTPIREGGYGVGGTGPIVRTSFPGDPVTASYWSMVNSNGSGTPVAPQELQFMLSAPAVTLAPGEATTFNLALVFGWGSSHLDSITRMRYASDVAQTLFDSGRLFGSTSLPPAPVAAPVLVSPADSTVVASDVMLAWDAVAGADYYVVELSRTPGFEAATVQVVTGTSVSIPTARLPVNSATALYWRARAGAEGLEGAPSPARRLISRVYVPGALRLVSGAPAFVERTAPGGAPACDGPGDPDEGCAEVGGDLVAGSINSTGDYRLRIGSTTAAVLAAAAPGELEFRFTTAGSPALRASTGFFRRIVRVPFEVWDIGPVTPGQANDPSDDRQLIPLLGPTAGPTPCAFGYFNSTPDGPGTAVIAASYPVGDDYAAYDAVARAAIASAPDGCPVSNQAAPAYAFVDASRPQPLEGVTLVQVSTRSVDELTGTTIRFYTADPFVADEPAPGAGTLALGAPYPNPAAGDVTLPLHLAAPAAVRVTVVDALGRTVAVLADGARPAGTHALRVDGRRLAVGVYAVVAETGVARAVRRLTVVR